MKHALCMAAALMLASTAWSDAVVSITGTRYEGQVAEDAVNCTIILAGGQKIVLPRAMVRTIERSPTKPAPAPPATAAAPRPASAPVLGPAAPGGSAIALSAAANAKLENAVVRAVRDEWRKQIAAQADGDFNKVARTDSDFRSPAGWKIDDSLELAGDLHYQVHYVRGAETKITPVTEDLVLVVRQKLDLPERSLPPETLLSRRPGGKWFAHLPQSSATRPAQSAMPTTRDIGPAQYHSYVRRLELIPPPDVASFTQAMKALIDEEPSREMVAIFLYDAAGVFKDGAYQPAVFEEQLRRLRTTPPAAVRELREAVAKASSEELKDVQMLGYMVQIARLYAGGRYQGTEGQRLRSRLLATPAWAPVALHAAMGKRHMVSQMALMAALDDRHFNPKGEFDARAFTETLSVAGQTASRPAP